MDVQCGLCGTEYELDDALVSDRGTTVRCTSCGHQFRAFPPGALGFAGDTWVVHTREGQVLQYASLKELQHALGAGHLAREDVLVRGQGPRRPLGSIAELDGFFKQAGSPSRDDGTLSGIAPPANPPTHPPANFPSERSGPGPGLASPVAPHYEALLRAQAHSQVGALAPSAPGKSRRGDFVATMPSVGAQTRGISKATGTSQNDTGAVTSAVGKSTLMSSQNKDLSARGEQPSGAQVWIEVDGHPVGGAASTAMRQTQASATGVSSQPDPATGGTLPAAVSVNRAGALDPKSTLVSPTSSGQSAAAPWSSVRDPMSGRGAVGSVPSPSMPVPMSRQISPPVDETSMKRTVRIEPGTPGSFRARNQTTIGIGQGAVPIQAVPVVSASDSNSVVARPQGSFARGTMRSADGTERVVSASAGASLPNDRGGDSSEAGAAVPIAGAPPEVSGRMSPRPQVPIEQVVSPSAQPRHKPSDPTMRSESTALAAEALQSARHQPVAVAFSGDREPSPEPRHKPLDPTMRSESTALAAEALQSARHQPVAATHTREPDLSARPGIPSAASRPSLPAHADPARRAIARRGGPLAAQIQSAAPPPAPGNRWMWIAVAVLVPTLGVGSAIAWNFFKQSRVPRVSPAPVQVAVASAKEVVTLIEQGRLLKAETLLSEMGSTNGSEGLALTRAMLDLANAELHHYIVDWVVDPDQARKQAAASLQLADRSVQGASAAASSQPALLGARLRLAWLRANGAEIDKFAKQLVASSAAGRDAFAAALAAHAPEPRGARLLAESLDSVAKREIAFGPVSAAAVAAWLQADDADRAAATLQRIPDAGRDAAWKAAHSFVSAKAIAVDETRSVDAGGVVEPAVTSGEPTRVYDFRERLAIAADAMKSGRMKLAEQHYRFVLKEQPGNSEALNGLAEAARSRGDNEGAARLYQQLLASNPNFMPALVGRADLLWGSGRRDEALPLYRRILERAGSGSSYGKVAASRIEQAEGTGVLPPREPEAVALTPEPEREEQATAPVPSAEPPESSVEQEPLPPSQQPPLDTGAEAAEAPGEDT